MSSPKFETITNMPRPRNFERPGSDIKKKGYLRKLKTMKKKYFVLRGTSSSGVARLEYYDSEKKYNNMSAPKRSIDLHTCFNINKKSDSKHKYAIALYTKDDCFTVLAENIAEQDEWLSVLLDYQLQYVYHDENREHFEHVWQVNIKAKGLALLPEHKHLRGNHRLCLSQNLCIVKLNTDKPLYTFQLATVRSLAISDCQFRMEVGSLATTGPGELWMGVDDSTTAQIMHDSIFQCMKAASIMEELDVKMKERQRSGTMKSTISPCSNNTQETPRNRTFSGTQQSPSRMRSTTSEKRPVSCSPSVSIGLHPSYNTVPSSSPLFTLEYPGDSRLRSDSTDSRASHRSKQDDAVDYHNCDVVGAISEEETSLDFFSSMPSSPNELLQEHLKMSPEDIGSQTNSYMMMNIGAATPPTINTGYMGMSSRSQRSCDTSPASVESDGGYFNMSAGRPPTSSPIPIRGPPELLYKDMTCHSSHLPTVTEGGSNEGYLPMSPTFGQSLSSSAHLKPEPAVCMLSDDSADFPKRTYSLGSKPPVNTSNKTSGYLDMTINKSVTDKGRSCSAPHLLPNRKIHADSPTPSASPLSSSMRSDESESFMEFDFYRPRTASDSYNYRPRASSFGNKSLQAHRPRSSSHGQQARTFTIKAFDSVRTTSEELRQSMNSCRGSSDSLRMSSSESLRKLSREVRAKTTSLLSTDYLDMSIDKRKTPSPQPPFHQSPKPNGYMDMTLSNRTSSPNRGRTPQERSGSFSSGTFNKVRDKVIQERSGSFSSGTSPRILPVSEIPKKKSYSSDKVNKMSSSLAETKPPNGDLYINMDMSSSQMLNESIRKSGKDNSRSSSSENLETYVMYEPKVSISINSQGSSAVKSIHRPVSADSLKRSAERPSKKEHRRKSSNQSKTSQNVVHTEQATGLDKNDEYIEFSPMNSSKSPEVKSSEPNSSIKHDLTSRHSDLNLKKRDSLNYHSPHKESMNNNDAEFVDCSEYMGFEPGVVSATSKELIDSSEYMGFEPGQTSTNMADTSKNIPVASQMVIQKSYFGNVTSGTKSVKPVSKVVTPDTKDGKKSAGGISSSVKVTRNNSKTKLSSVFDESEYLDFEPAAKNLMSAQKEKPNLVPKQNIALQQTENISSNMTGKLSVSENITYVEDDYLLTEKVEPLVTMPAAPLTVPFNPPCVLSVDCNSRICKIPPAHQQIDKTKTEGNTSLQSASLQGGDMIKIDPTQARHSISDLSGYEQMTFPSSNMSHDKPGSTSSMSSTGKNGSDKSTLGLASMGSPANVVSSMCNLSASSQLLGGEETLNYASLDLGSSENVGEDVLRSPRIKNRHASATEEKMDPLSYAEIDFEKSEGMKAVANARTEN